jgi:hypothetical protein
MLTTQEAVKPLRRVEDEVVYIPQEREVVKTPQGVVVHPQYKFDKLPKKISFGAVAVCPRCRGKTQKYKFKGIDDKRHKDPLKDKTPCVACNGWGLVPNVGAIAMTAPEGM